MNSTKLKIHTIVLFGITIIPTAQADVDFSSWVGSSKNGATAQTTQQPVQQSINIPTQQDDRSSNPQQSRPTQTSAPQRPSYAPTPPSYMQQGTQAVRNQQVEAKSDTSLSQTAFDNSQNDLMRRIHSASQTTDPKATRAIEAYGVSLTGLAGVRAMGVTDAEMPISSVISQYNRAVGCINNIGAPKLTGNIQTIVNMVSAAYGWQSVGSIINDQSAIKIGSNYQVKCF